MELARVGAALQLSQLDAEGVVQVLRSDRRDDALLALFPTEWRLRTITNDHPDLLLEPLLADTT